MKRRTFLKIAGLGSISLAGCTSQAEKNLYALLNAAEDGITGRASWYASTCRECPAGCGILAKNREGRIIKLEGNPLHPVNKGKLCIRGQAALQGVYNPQRLKSPLLKEKGGFRPVSYEEAGKYHFRQGPEGCFKRTKQGSYDDGGGWGKPRRRFLIRPLQNGDPRKPWRLSLLPMNP